MTKQFDYNYSINILVMVVLGGMGSFTGSILSAIVLTILPEVLSKLCRISRMIVYPLILIIMMLFRPKGLLGREEFQISKIISYFTNKSKRGENNGTNHKDRRARGSQAEKKGGRKSISYDFKGKVDFVKREKAIREKMIADITFSSTDRKLVS